MSAASDKPVLVALHGWGIGAAVWESLAKYFADRFDFRGLHLPGYGGTPALAARGLDATLDWLGAQVPAGAHLLGWSLGGNLLHQLACKHPGEYASLVCVASNPCFLANDDWPGMDPARFRQFLDNLAASPEQTLRQFSALVALGGANSRAIARNLRQLLAAQASVDPLVLADGLNWLGETDYRDSLEPGLPQRHILCREDQLVPVAVANHMPDTVLIDGGHCPMLAAAEELTAQLDAFYAATGASL